MKKMETILRDQLIEQCMNGLVIMRNIRLWALQVAKQHDISYFKAPTGWCPGL